MGDKIFIHSMKINKGKAHEIRKEYGLYEQGRSVFINPIGKASNLPHINSLTHTLFSI